MRLGRFSRSGLIMLALLAAVLIGLRAYLPVWATGYVNRQIAALDGYSGGVDDIDIHLWRGAYQIHGLRILKDKGGLRTPFVAARTVDLSVEWKALLHGAVVAEIDLRDIAVTFAKTQTGAGAGWAGLVDALSPFDINRLEVHGGKIAYVDYNASPDVNIALQDITAKVTNLKNVESREVSLPSDMAVSGSSIGGGKLAMTGKINALKNVPDFDIDARFENADLTAFNDYTREAAAVDFKRGTFSVYSELAAAKGTVTGYVKPVLRDVDVVDLRQDSNPLNALWESVVAGFMGIFKNHGEDQFALRIPVRGTVDDTQRDMLSGFFSIFQNAFGKAFPRNTDGTINLRDALQAARE